MSVEPETKSERTKKAIVEQAIYLFQKRGYESVTMRDLAKECELSLGAFYYHFASKEEIVLELFRASLSGHVDRTTAYLASTRPSLEAAMTWICRDRFKEFASYRAVLRVLVQRLDPHDPVSPWHATSQPIRRQSIELFEKVVSTCLPSADGQTRRHVARALWLQHLVILAAWSFERSEKKQETEVMLKRSIRIWKRLPTLLRIPGMSAFIGLVLSPLEKLEKENL